MISPEKHTISSPSSYANGRGPRTVPLDEEREAYRAATSEREKAAIEQRVWEAAPAELRRGKKFGRITLLRDLIGASPYEVAQRTPLHMAGAAADPLWGRIENEKMALLTAARLLRNAKRLATSKKIDLARALEAILRDHDAKPLMHMKSGRTARRRIPGGWPETPAPAEAPATPSKQRHEDDEPKNEWQAIERAAKRLIQERLTVFSPEIADELWRTFQKDLRVVIVDVQERMQRVVDGRSRRIHISRRQLEDACLALHLEAPPHGVLPDLDKARRNKKKLARAYHPDANDGDESKSQLMHGVLDAFATVEAYCNQEKRTITQ